MRLWVWTAVALVVAGFLAAPYLFVFERLPVVIACAAALAGWWPRRSWADALALSLPIVAADLLEHELGAEVLACLVLPLYAVTRRPWFSATAGTVLLLVFHAAMELKRRFAGSRLIWDDVRFFFTAFRENVGVLASQPTVLLALAAAVAVIALLGAAAWTWDKRARAGQVPGRNRAWVASLLAVAALGWSAYALEGKVRAVERQGVIKVATWGAPLTRFLATVRLRAAWQPPHVETQAFRALAAHRIGGGTGERPDIVLFLQESQINPEALDGCPATLCRVGSGFDPGASTAAFGPLRVHTFGGATWTSEFAVTTGVPHTAFGPGGTFVPFNVAPGVRKSFVRSLKALGYRTVAVYPVGGGMMNARTAYAAYGFDRFYDAPELGLSGTYETSDRAIHEAALRVLDQERRDGRPVYLFVLTIFNHGEHGRDMARVPAELTTLAKNAFADDAEAENVADYAWRTRLFATAFERTMRGVLGGGRPAVVGWFGDHQPAFGGALGLTQRMRSLPWPEARIPPRYQTWYRVDSNMPARQASPRTEALDLVFLPGLLAEIAGLPLDDWLASNVTARRECGGLLLECARPAARDAYLAHLYQDLQAFRLP